MPTIFKHHSYLESVYDELTNQLARYLELMRTSFEIEGRLEVVERTLTATRDFLLTSVDEADRGIPIPWKQALQQCRFVGVRPADACVQIVKERGSLTTDEIIQELKNGLYRFRTNTPLREINAALLRQRKVKREGDRWIYRETPVEPIATEKVKEEV